MSLVPVPQDQQHDAGRSAQANAPQQQQQRQPEQEHREAPRDPSLQGVLRWVVNEGGGSQALDRQDAPHELDPESKEFLRKVLDSMSVDVIKEIQKTIDAIKDTSQPVDDRLEHLEMLADYCEDLNIARDIDKIGGLQPALDLLSSDQPELQAGAAQVLAAIVQNDPVCQQLAVDRSFVSHIMPLLRSEHSSVQRTAMTVISGMIRGNDTLLQEFLNYRDSLSSVFDVLTNGQVRSRVKAAWLLKHLFRLQRNVVEDAMIANDTPAKLLTGLSQTEDNTFWEHTLALIGLSMDSDKLREQFQLRAADVHKLLSQRKAHIESMDAESQEAHIEELEHANKLRKALQA